MTVSNEQMEQVRERAQDGQSSRRIAEMTGVPATTVRRLLKENGWGAATVVGKDGRKRKGTRTVPNLHPAPGECGVCDDPDCDGHNDELEQPNEFLPCWACARTGAVRDARGRRVVPCTVCRACGWLLADQDDRFPSNRYGAAWATANKDRWQNEGWDVWEVAQVWEQGADWDVLTDVLGRTVVTKASTVKRDWRSTGDLSAAG